MKIAVISSTILPCKSQREGGYGGLEPIVWTQADGLVKEGHQVLFIAPHGSTIPEGAEHHGTTLGESEGQAYSGYWQKLPEQDIILDHSWNKFSTLLKIDKKFDKPILLWCHAPIETMFNSLPPYSKPCLVAISKDQAGAIGGHLGADTRVCYHGIDLNFYKSDNTPRSNRYLFLARMSKLKGPHLAISVAKKCNIMLDLVGDDKLVENKEYALNIKKECDDFKIIYRGEASRETCVKYFSQAKALFHLAHVFREPLGLSPIEAQACGCPVIASDHGAMRETIKHGETGFLVRTPEEVVEIIKSGMINTIKSEVCRDWASQFSIEKFINRTQILIKEALETGGW